MESLRPKELDGRAVSQADCSLPSKDLRRMVKNLSNQAKRLQEQREWMRSYEQLKAWEEIVISSDDEGALLEQITVPKISGSGTSRAKNTR